MATPNGMKARLCSRALLLCTMAIPDMKKKPQEARCRVSMSRFRSNQPSR